jgi:hypothetical protein
MATMGLAEAHIESSSSQRGGAATKTFTTEFTEEYRDSERFGVNLVSWNNRNLRELCASVVKIFLPKKQEGGAQ